jgi:hypothetical protein
MVFQDFGRFLRKFRLNETLDLHCTPIGIHYITDIIYNNSKFVTFGEDVTDDYHDTLSLCYEVQKYHPQ